MRGRKLKTLAALLLAALLGASCGVAAPEPAESAASPTPPPTPAATVPAVQTGTLHATVAVEGAVSIRVVGDYAYDRERGLSFTLELANPWDCDNHFSLGLCLNGYTDYPGRLYIAPEGEEPGEPVSGSARFTVRQPPGVTRYSVLFVPTADSLIRSAADIDLLDALAMTYVFYYHPDAHTREFAQGVRGIPVGSGNAAPELEGVELYSDGSDSLIYAGYNGDSHTLLLGLRGGENGARYRLRPTLEGFDCLRFSTACETEPTEDDIYVNAGRIPEGMVSLMPVCIERALAELGADQPRNMSLHIWSARPGQGASAAVTETAIPLDTQPQRPFGELESYPVVMYNQLFRLRLIKREGNCLSLSVENHAGLDMWLKFKSDYPTGTDAAVYLSGESLCAIPPLGRCVIQVRAYNELLPSDDGSPGALSGEADLSGAMDLSCLIYYSSSHEAKPNELYEQMLTLPE